MICSITEHYNRAKRPTQLVCHLGLLSSSILNTGKPGTEGTALCICFPLLKMGIAALVRFFQVWGFTISGLLTELCFD